MYLSRHATTEGACWALDGHYLPSAFTLDLPLQMPAGDFQRFLEGLPRGEAAEGFLLPPVEPAQSRAELGVAPLVLAVHHRSPP
jgi:2-dehydro-3-deoxy-D-arabinonate dehydratase